jgi:hypothetical protein
MKRNLVRLQTQRCPICHNDGVIEVTPEQAERIQAWVKNPVFYIQQALSDLSPGIREQILTGCHEACFDRLLGDDSPDWAEGE